MLSALLPAFLAIAAGISIVIQQALNANLRNAMHSTAWSGFVSYAVGLACMAQLVPAFRDPAPSASVAARIPWWAWSGGLFGSITFDHFGWLGLTQRPVDAPRLIGVALLIGGVVLIRR
jgi:transporter family-2 protein